MITTKRSGSENTSYTNNKSSVAVLDRPVSTYSSFVGSSVKEESVEEASARMRENLQKLLNYDRYTETVKDSVAVIEETPTNVQENKPEESACLDEDIRPTSTTMQFGDDADVDIRNEVAAVKTEEKQSYKLSMKGKIIIALYSVVVALVFALIVINTTMLSRVKNDISLKQQELAQIQTEYQLSEERLQELENQVPEKAEEMGMIK